MNLKDLRAAHVPPLTQTQLAAAAHISLRMVQEWEAGRRSIDRASLETLCDIANALDCRIHALIQSPVLLAKLDDAVNPLRKHPASSLYGAYIDTDMIGGGDDHDDV